MTRTAGAATASDDIPSGLARNSIGLLGVLFISTATMGPGVGIALSIAVGAPFAGGALPLSVLLAMIAALLVAVGVGQLAKHISSAGGIADYIGEAIHPAAGYVAAWIYSVCYTVSIGALGLVFGTFVAGAIVPSGTGTTYHVVWVVSALAMFGVAYAANVFGVELSARAGIVLGVVEIVIFAVLAGWLIVKAGHHNTFSVFTAHAATAAGFQGLPGVVAGTVFGFLAFAGFEASAAAGEEAMNPKKSIPWAIVGSVVLVGVFFLFGTYAATAFFRPENMSSFFNFNSGNPWAGMAKQVWGEGWVVVLIALLFSTLAVANGSTIAASRTMVSMAEQRHLPAVLVKTGRRHTPVVAMSLSYVIALIPAFSLGEYYGPVAAFALLLAVLIISILPIYFVAAVACPIYYLRYRRDEFNWLLHLLIPVLGAAALVPEFFAGAGIRVFSFISSLTYPTSLAGPIVLAWYFLGFAGAIYLFVLRPRRQRGIEATLNPSTENTIH